MWISCYLRRLADFLSLDCSFLPKITLFCCYFVFYPHCWREQTSSKQGHFRIFTYQINRTCYYTSLIVTIDSISKLFVLQCTARSYGATCLALRLQELPCMQKTWYLRFKEQYRWTWGDSTLVELFWTWNECCSSHAEEKLSIVLKLYLYTSWPDLWQDIPNTREVKSSNISRPLVQFGSKIELNACGFGTWTSSTLRQIL